MNRRHAVQRVALLLGGSVLGAELFIQSGCQSAKKETVHDFFTTDEIHFLDEVAETIIPKTNTPGAKDAQTGAFMNVMVRDCYNIANQQIFKEGMAAIENKSREKFGNTFIQLTAAQKTELLTEINKEQVSYHQSKSEKDPTHYFRMMRELTLLGFFTSEPGATKALCYVAVPGKYDPCIPYIAGQKAWAM